ncbi:GntR family transcriptional regulator [Thalassotalea sp. SU-HH00458]|uniref:GntR family transcriptional regulator n=1 Tax=Thalassotalea sp. SU-HH00458 TaxID=3127657 RepID=UPI0031080F9B
MSGQSFLIQETVNNILSSLPDTLNGASVVLKENTLAKRFNVSRTTIRTSIQELEKLEIIQVDGSIKTVIRLPEASDYFDISDQVSTKEEIIEKYFLDLINKGKLLPGHKFSELELAKASGCNTITVREFLIKFSRFGLIDKKPRAKWQMVEFDEKFATELVEFRRILEMNSITKLIAKPQSDPAWKQLSELLDDHKEVLADFDNRYLEFSKLDSRLHYIIQEASENRFFMQFFDVVSLICHYHYQWDKHDEHERNFVALNEHIEILTHLLAHNTSGVLNAMEKHLNTARETLLGSASGLK